MKISVMRMTLPIGCPEVKFDRAFAGGAADAYAGLQEVGPLVLIPLPGGYNQQGFSCFGKKFLLIKIAKLPDEMKQHFAYSVIPHDLSPPFAN
jgi:hypothetical protein